MRGDCHLVLFGAYMKFKCERDVLVESLATAGRAVNKGLPGLSGIQAILKKDTLSLTGTDRDLTIAVDVKVSGSTDGEAVIPARLAADIVKAIKPGAVSIEVSGDSLQITSGRSEFSIRLIASDDFPKLVANEAETFTLSAEELNESLQQVVLAASSDDSRPILTGVLLASEGDGLRLVATDSYRLAMRDIKNAAVLKKGQSVLIPSRALEELNKVLDKGDKVDLQLGDSEAAFVVGDIKITTRLIEGEFPNYRGLIPDSHPNKLTVNRGEFLEALRRVKLLARESTPVRLEMNSDGVELVAVTQDVGTAREFVEGQYDGSDLIVAFNPQYLAEGVEVTPGDEMTLSTIDELKPALIHSVGVEDLLYLLMPVRVS